jgi:hypothetical protein
MSHIYEKPKSTSPFNVPLSTGENARKKIDLPKNIGFRGRHAHGKAPDDPVYPTRQLAPTPKLGFVDWRNGGRALLVAAMALIEGKILRTRSAIMKWQMFPPCSPKCMWSCHKARNRVLCSWFVPGSVHEHFVKMDGLLTQFKGPKYVSIQNPPFRPMSQVAHKNRFNAVAMEWKDGKFVHLKPLADPAFGLRSDMRNNNDDGYDSDEDSEMRDMNEIEANLVKFDEKSRQEAEMISRSL